ncbi:MAG: hypothetical protein ABI120_17670 [Gemmatimonadaceae bacterium]
MSVLVVSDSENESEELLAELEADNVVEAVADTRPTDERANVPVSVVTERFLRAILDKVPLDRIQELHLFAPLRQGTIETGIAVVAARVIVLDEIAVPTPLELQLDGDASTPVDPTEAEAVEFAVEETEEVVEMNNESPYADEPVQLKLVPSSESAAAEDDERAGRTTALITSAPEVINAEADESSVRYTVYTAWYRLIIKGPERGKWEMDVVDEADAPLVAVETVVRGVQRRAGEETATVRYDASQLAHVLRLPVPESP